MTTYNEVTWSQIEAECGDYREGFVATFRKYEGQFTDEKDEQGRTVKVTMASFARHVGIPRVTFQQWVSTTVRVVQPEDRARKEDVAVRSAIRRLTPERRAEVARELLNEPEVAAQVVDDPTARIAIHGALDERYDRVPKPYPSHPEPGAADDAMQFVAALRKVHKDLAELVRIAHSDNVIIKHSRDAILAETHWMRNALDLIDSGVDATGSFEQQVAALLDAEL